MNRAICNSSDMVLAVCHNDGQGADAGRVSYINVLHPLFGETCLELEHDSAFAEHPGTPFGAGWRLLTLHGYSFRFSHRAEWVGSMLWNEYSMPATYAVGLLNVLQATGEWTPLNGYEELMDAWGKTNQFTPRDFGFDTDLTYGFHESGTQLILFSNQ